MKRENYISWNPYFIGIALLSKGRSKGRNMFVNNQKRIVTTGYNGLPNGYGDDTGPWDRREGFLEETKCAYSWTC